MASDFNPLSLISSPISGAFNYAGAKQEADAQKYAANLQAQAAQEALDFTKQKQAQWEQEAAPYQSVGTQAVQALPGIARQAPTYGPPNPYTTQPAATAPQTGAYPIPTTLSGMAQPMLRGGPMARPPAPAGGMPPPQPMGGGPQMPQATGGGITGGMVLLAAPDGTQQYVPASQAQAYIAKGARPVGAGS